VQVKWALLLIVAVVVALFALQNTETVSVRLFLYALDGVSVALVILGTAAVTAAATLVLGISEWLGHKGEVRRLRREIAQRDARIAELTRPAPVITELPTQIPHRTVESS
jgi:uncharacterized integral membrane protein